MHLILIKSVRFQSGHLISIRKIFILFIDNSVNLILTVLRSPRSIDGGLLLQITFKKTQAHVRLRGGHYRSIQEELIT